MIAYKQVKNILLYTQLDRHSRNFYLLISIEQNQINKKISMKGKNCRAFAMIGVPV